MNRRQFLVVAASTFAANQSRLTAGQSPSAKKYKALAFDAFVIFDPRPVFQLAASAVPGIGEEFVRLWKARQFEYMWLRTLSGHYADFRIATRDALVFTAKTLKIDLDANTTGRLLDAYSRLRAWPDVVPALRQLKDAGIRLGLLSNFSEEMLRANVESAALTGVFDQMLSTDPVRAFKPDPRAYRMALKAFRLNTEEIAFAAFAGWDAAGAKSFGYPTFWVNRQNDIEEELDAHADGSGTIEELVRFTLA
jgi:2-haloacid dehalogenase